MNMKKIIALILALVCVMSVFAGCDDNNNSENPDVTTENKTESGTVDGGETDIPSHSPEDDFEFEAGENGLIVTKYLGSSKKIVIPSVVENKKVVNINADVFGGNIVVEEIVLSEYMTSLYLSAFKGCDNLKLITYSGVVSLSDYHHVTYMNNAGDLPENLTTMIFPALKTVDVRHFKYISSYAPQVTTYICENATELKEQSYENYFNKSINLVVPKSLIDDIKSKTVYVYNVFDRVYNYSSEEFELKEKWSEWGFKDSFLQIWADRNEGHPYADTLIDESELSLDFIEYVENILDSHKEDGATDIEYYYFKDANNHMVVKYQLKDADGIQHGFVLWFGDEYYYDEDNNVHCDIAHYSHYRFVDSVTDANGVVSKYVTDAKGVISAFFGASSITVNGTEYSYDLWSKILP